MAEADKAGREDMEQEAAEKGMGVHGHLLQRIAVPPVARGAADVARADVAQAGMRAGDTRRITTKRVDALGGPRPGGCGIHEPRRGGEVVKEVCQALGGGAGSRGGVAGERGGRAGLRQGVEACGAAARPSGLDGGEKRRRRGPPPGAGIGQGAAWDQTGPVAVRVEALVPRMEDHNPTQLTTEVVLTALEQRLASGRK